MDLAIFPSTNLCIRTFSSFQKMYICNQIQSIWIMMKFQVQNSRAHVQFFPIIQTEAYYLMLYQLKNERQKSIHPCWYIVVFNWNITLHELQLQNIYWARNVSEGGNTSKKSICLPKTQSKWWNFRKQQVRRITEIDRFLMLSF